MDETLFGYLCREETYDWHTNDFYKIGFNDPATKTRMPDVVCTIELDCIQWLAALDSLLVWDTALPRVWLPDGSQMPLKVLDIHPYRPDLPHYRSLVRDDTL